MHTTAEDLQNMAHFIRVYGLHRGDQFAHLGPVITLDISALAYTVTEHGFPEVFFTDGIASTRLIESSARAMACIQAISHVLDSDVNETEIAPGVWVPDYIEHVSTWAMTPGIGCTQPPTDSEVIDRIQLAAQAVATQTSTAPAA